MTYIIRITSMAVSPRTCAFVGMVSAVEEKRAKIHEGDQRGSRIKHGPTCFCVRRQNTNWCTDLTIDDRL
jgi:hypothetical protein